MDPAIRIDAKPASPDEVSCLQIVLERSTCPGLAIDGTLGPRTVMALRRFQAQRGLATTGALDETTLWLVLTGALDLLGVGRGATRTVPGPIGDDLVRTLARRRIREFQQILGLEADGEPGPDTLAALLEQLEEAEEPTGVILRRLDGLDAANSPSDHAPTRIYVEPPKATSERGELDAVSFPPSPCAPSWHALGHLTSIAEERSGIPGLRTFLLAVAAGTSNACSSMLGVADDPTLPLRALFMRRTFERRLARNPWRPRRPDPLEPATARWSYVGGWFALAPAVALATMDRRGHRHDPARVFDPAFSVAYATDLVVRLRGRAGSTWSDLRSRWSCPLDAARLQTTSASARYQLARELARVPGVGLRSSIPGELVVVDDYPGFTTVLMALLRSEGPSR